jgi:hypothetical protein
MFREKEPKKYGAVKAPSKTYHLRVESLDGKYQAALEIQLWDSVRLGWGRKVGHPAKGADIYRMRARNDGSDVVPMMVTLNDVSGPKGNEGRVPHRMTLAIEESLSGVLAVCHKATDMSDRTSMNLVTSPLGQIKFVCYAEFDSDGLDAGRLVEPRTFGCYGDEAAAALTIQCKLDGSPDEDSLVDLTVRLHLERNRKGGLSLAPYVYNYDYSDIDLPYVRVTPESVAS